MSTELLRKVTVRVPATTANLGPGFDSLGLALTLYNRFEVERVAEGCDAQVAAGTWAHTELARQLPGGADNLVIQAAQATWNVLGLPPGGWRVRTTIDVPLGSGLGSSATAIVAGIVAANALAGNPLPADELLKLATRLEGHADNVAPALLGGFTVVVVDRGSRDTTTGQGAEDMRIVWQRSEPEQFEVVVAVPDEALPTARSRQALPETVPHADAAFNVARASLLTAAMMTGDSAALAAAMADRLHEPYRAGLVPGFFEVVAAARREGALGAALSGAGPSVVAFLPAGAAPEPVGIAMTDAFRAAGIGARWLALKPDHRGAVIEQIGA